MVMWDPEREKLVHYQSGKSFNLEKVNNLFHERDLTELDFESY